MATPHIGAEKGAFAKTVIMPGDPLRAKMIAEKYPRERIRIGGHSKGGNIAIYAAITVPEKIQKRIIDVVNYDGPGFNMKKVNENKGKDILNKIFTFIPQESIFGRIMEHAEKCEVILSIEKGVYQHDIYSWQVLRDKMVRAESLTDESNRINNKITNWLENTTPDQRKIFVDSVFEIFYSTEANNFEEINWIKNVPIIISAYKGLSPEDRKTLIEMITLFGKYFIAKPNK